MKPIGWLATAVFIAAGARNTNAAQLQLSTGVEYSSGKYGETIATEALVLPFSVKLRVGGLSLRASIPYVTVRGPASIAPVIDDSGGSHGSNSGSGSSGDSSDDDDAADSANRDLQGLGDASVSATWTFSDIAATPLYMDLSARARLPAGSETKGLGNGATDFTAQSEIGWDGRRGGVFVSGGRRFLESRPGSTRVDGWQASAGYWRNIGQKSMFGMQGNWRRGSTLGSEDPKSVDAYLTRRLSTGWRLEVSGSAGLSDASPDYSVGLGFIWRSTANR